jgi:hypothetical protein
MLREFQQNSVALRRPHFRERPYQHDSTTSRLLCEVKHVRARLVLRWGTTLESRVLFSFAQSPFSWICQQNPYFLLLCHGSLDLSTIAIVFEMPWSKMNLFEKSRWLSCFFGFKPATCFQQCSIRFNVCQTAIHPEHAR